MNEPMKRSGTEYFFHVFLAKIWAELADESGLEFKMLQCFLSLKGASNRFLIVSDQKYSRLRCLLRVKGLVIGCYLG